MTAGSAIRLSAESLGSRSLHWKQRLLYVVYRRLSLLSRLMAPSFCCVLQAIDADGSAAPEDRVVAILPGIHDGVAGGWCGRSIASTDALRHIEGVRGSEATVIDCTGTGMRGVSIVDASPVLTGLTWRGGDVGGDDGGCVRITGAAAAPELTDIRVLSCSAERGGGLFVTGGASASLSGGAVSGNVAASHGGGLYVDASSSVTADNTVLVSENEAVLGGAVYLAGSGSSLVGTRVADGDSLGDAPLLRLNEASDGGGGVYVGASGATLSDVSISLNTADRGGGLMLASGVELTSAALRVSSNEAARGGGIFLSSSAELTLQDSDVGPANSADDGGALYAASGSLLAGSGGRPVDDVVGVRGSALSGAWLRGNSARNRGGGAFLADGASIESVGVAGNDAPAGGGIAVLNGAPTLTHVLIAECDAREGGGGGVYVAGSAVLTAEDTLVARCTVIGSADGEAGNEGAPPASKGGGGILLEAASSLIGTAGVLHVEACVASGGTNGGGAAVTQGSDLRSATFTGCDADAGRGGGVWVEDQAASLIDVDIDSCTAARAGGGIGLADAAEVAVSTTTIVGCSAPAGGGFVAQTDASITGDLSVESCDADDRGGGVLCVGCHQIVGASISACTAPIGGGIAVEDEGTTGLSLLEDLVVDGCTATADGGGCVSFGNTRHARLSNATLRACDASVGSGGCARLLDATVQHGSNVVLDGCTAQRGGGLSMIDSSLSSLGDEPIQIVDTVAADSGGGVSMWGAAWLEQVHVSGCLAQVSCLRLVRAVVNRCCANAGRSCHAARRWARGRRRLGCGQFHASDGYHREL